MGILVDHEIKNLIENEVIIQADIKSVFCVGYDLHTLSYYDSNKNYYGKIRLSPNDSTFVCCEECVDLPENLCATIQIRNSRIRQGFQLEAPLYQPGHKTRVYFRLTNISRSVIDLTQEDNFASIIFHRLDNSPTKPYNGTFQNEGDTFFDMGIYTEKYINSMNEKKEFAFLIMPFNEPWSNDLNKLIKDVGQDIGLEIVRADDIYGIQPVMYDVAKSIDRAKVVIAILTGGNRNVNYELGLAHAWSKPSIMIADKIQDIPFDYQHLRVLLYNIAYPNWGDKLKDELKSTLKAIDEENILGFNYFETFHM